MTLRDLLERVERATGPDRKLDRAIWYAVVQDNPPAGEKDPTHAALYTSSVDAALALIGRVLPGWCIQLGVVNSEDHAADATLWQNPDGPCRYGFGATPALALCAALIAAKIEQENTNG